MKVSESIDNNHERPGRKVRHPNGVPFIDFEAIEVARPLFGENEEHLRVIERILGVRLSTRGTRLFIDGQDYDVEMVRNLMDQLKNLQAEGFIVNAGDIEHATHILASGKLENLKEVFLDRVLITAKRRAITPKSVNQKRYVDAIRNHDIVFGIGPAGTGKTYLAMAMAVGALVHGEVERIVLTRPAVEAGEKLGFLPGDLMEKVNPYLRPLYDALYDMMSFEKAKRLIESGVIEVAPLAFMRGRTLNDSFVILDEAQNSTPEQMKMFLTRLGFHSKAVITGDITQIDLSPESPSGLVIIQKILGSLPGIEFVYFDKEDVVRHPLVQDIIRAYEEYEQSAESSPLPTSRRRE